MDGTNPAKASLTEFLRNFGGGFAMFLITLLVIRSIPTTYASVTSSSAVAIVSSQQAMTSANSVHQTIVSQQPSFSPNPVFVSVSRPDLQTIRLAGIGQPGVGYVLEGSLDLRTWEALSVTYPSSSDLTFDIRGATVQKHFFRITALAPNNADQHFASNQPATDPLSTGTVVNTGPTEPVVTGILGNAGN